MCQTQARNANILPTTLSHETEVSGFSSDLLFFAASLSLVVSVVSYFLPTSASSSFLVSLQPFQTQTYFPSRSAPFCPAPFWSTPFGSAGGGIYSRKSAETKRCPRRHGSPCRVAGAQSDEFSHSCSQVAHSSRRQSGGRACSTTQGCGMLSRRICRAQPFACRWCYVEATFEQRVGSVLVYYVPSPGLR